MAKKYKNFEEAKAAIIAHAWKNPEFKAKLLKNPRSAFKEMGVDLSQEIDVRIVEEKGNTFTFVLPRAVVDVEELSEDQLRRLAGGACMQGKDQLNTAFQMYVTYVVQIAGSDTTECRRAIGSSGPK